MACNSSQKCQFGLYSTRTRNTREREREEEEEVWGFFFPLIRGQPWLDFTGHGIAVGIFLLYQEEKQGGEKGYCKPSPEAGRAFQRQKRGKKKNLLLEMVFVSFPQFKLLGG